MTFKLLFRAELYEIPGLHFSFSTLLIFWWASLVAQRWTIHLQCGGIPGLGRSPGGGHDSPTQCSCLQNPMGRGAWWATAQELQNFGGNGRASVSASLQRVCSALLIPVFLIRFPHLASKTPQSCFPCFLGVPVDPFFPSGLLVLLLSVLPRFRKRHGIIWYYKTSLPLERTSRRPLF